jgi:hypothetical protein
LDQIPDGHSEYRVAVWLSDVEAADLLMRSIRDSISVGQLLADAYFDRAQRSGQGDED